MNKYLFKITTNILYFLLVFTAAASLGVAVSVKVCAQPLSQNRLLESTSGKAYQSILVLTSKGKQLTRFYSVNPNTTFSVGVTGIVKGEMMAAIDYRPSTGELYSLGVNEINNSATLYKLDPRTAVAAVIGSPGTIKLSGSRFNSQAELSDPEYSPKGYGFDFNPADDLILVTYDGHSLYVSPENGEIAEVSLNKSDELTPDIQEHAYTLGSDKDGKTALYTIDASSGGVLIRSNLTASGSDLIPAIVNGNTLDSLEVDGFDIPANITNPDTLNNSFNGKTAFFAAVADNFTHLYSVDLITGFAVDHGIIGSGAKIVSGLTVE